MELALNLSDFTNSISEKVSELQEKFLNSTFGSAINNALDVGLRFILPDVIEDDIVEIKDAFIEEGFKEGVTQIVDNAKDFAKSVLGIFSGNFENISQVKKATEEGGIIDTISGLLDKAINKLEEKGILKENFADLIRSAKNGILNTTSSNISKDLDDQLEYTEKLEKYIEEWKEGFENQNFESMEKAYNQIEKYLDKTMVTENIFTNARIVENLHNLIKNKDQNFDLTNEEIELAEKLY